MGHYSEQIKVFEEQLKSWKLCIPFLDNIKDNPTSYSDAISGTMEKTYKGILYLTQETTELSKLNEEDVKETTAAINKFKKASINRKEFLKLASIKTAQEKDAFFTKILKSLGYGAVTIIKILPIVNILYNVWKSIEYIHYSIETSEELKTECKIAGIDFNNGNINTRELAYNISDCEDPIQFMSLLRVLKFYRFLTILGKQFEMTMLDWVRDCVFIAIEFFTGPFGLGGVAFDVLSSVFINFYAAPKYVEMHSIQFESIIAIAAMTITTKVSETNFALQKAIKAEEQENTGAVATNGNQNDEQVNLSKKPVPTHTKVMFGEPTKPTNAVTPTHRRVTFGEGNPPPKATA